MDINKLILETEKQADKLRLQSEQEKALAEVLPMRFAQNLAAFEQFIPDIANTFREYQPSRPFRFFCNENGIPNLIWLDDNVALYGDDPHSQAKNQIDEVVSSASVRRFNFGVEKDLFNQIHVQYLNKMVDVFNTEKAVHKSMSHLPDSIPMGMMFGVGLGYQLGYLYERCKIKHLFIFEPEMDLFYASLFTFDWAPLLSYLKDENLGVHIFLGQDEDSIMSDLLVALNKRGAFWSANLFGFWHYPSNKIFRLVERVAKEFYMLSSGWGFFDDNLFALSHSAENISKKTPFLLKNRSVSQEDAQVPVFIIGNGPSLDEAIPYIKRFQEKALLVSCGTSISALHKAGIKPDIYVAVERTKSVPDFIRLINDSSYLRDILFLSVDVIHPDCHEFFERMGVGFKPNEPMYPLLLANCKGIDDFSVINFVNPLVGNIGVSMPVTLGFRRIYMFGLDNGYKDLDHHHSKHSAYYDKDGNPIHGWSQHLAKSGGFLVPANFGGEVIANRYFAVSARVMESLLKYHGDVKCFNCSDGALVKGAEPLPLESLAISSQAVNKKRIIDFVYETMFKQLPVESDDLQGLLDVTSFNHIVDKMIEQWREPSRDREVICERMDRQYQYLVHIASTRLHHIYRVLSGTTNYLFTVLATVLYSFEDDSVTFKVFDAVVEIMIDYFEETKKRYPLAFSAKDSSDCELMNLYRNNNLSTDEHSVL